MFLIDDDGRPHTLKEEIVMEVNEDWNCNREKLLEFVQSMDEERPDGAISRMLLRCADDLSSGTPFITSFSAPLVGAMRNAGEGLV